MLEYAVEKYRFGDKSKAFLRVLDYASIGKKFEEMYLPMNDT